MKFRSTLVTAFILAAATAASAQGMLTAPQFFEKVSATYAGIKDYEAQVTVKAGKSTMSGTVIYKSPTWLRMDFTQPAEQTILYNGENLIIYVPELRATLSQQTSPTGGASAATGEGLKMLGRKYSVRYESASPGAALPLPGSESESAIRLVFERNSTAEGFRTITLYINPSTLLIRRMEGVTIAGDLIVYDFLGIKLNQGLADTRFLYDAPASANVYSNFLFGTDE